MGKNHPKRVISWEQPSREKSPTAVSFSAYSDTTACWRIVEDPDIRPVMSTPEIIQMKTKLSDFESNTWNESFVRDAKSNHRVSTGDLKCSIARKWMLIHMPDQPYLWMLRCSGKGRIWGILSEDAYQVVFWDPNHLILEVPKR